MSSDRVDPTASVRDVVAAMHRRQEENARLLGIYAAGRNTLLYIHAAAALTIGPLFGWYTSYPGVLAGPSWAIARHIPLMPRTLAAALFLAGSMLMLGTASNHLGLIRVGLLFALGWLVVVAVSFAGAVVLWLAAGAPGTGGPHRTPVPGLYAPLVYGWVAAILAVHLRGIHRQLSTAKPGTS